MMRSCWVLCFAAAAYGQQAGIEGKVLSDTNARPLVRAEVTLRPAEEGLPAIGVETDEKGHFLLMGIPPGKYRFLTERDGYLPGSTATHGAFRMPAIFALEGGDRLRDITIRLRPWAVVGGKVKYDDGEPAVGILVRLYREIHQRGRHGYSVAGQARTDDLGEYRVHGLPPGAYYIAAVYDRGPAKGVVQEPQLDPEGHPLPDIGYTTTFYPSATRLFETNPIHLDYGQEVNGMDIVLNPVRRVSIRGRAASAVSGNAVPEPSITLERVDMENAAGVPLNVEPAYNKDGSFTLRGVPPGPYILELASSDIDKVIQARVPLLVGQGDIDDLDVMLEPPQQAPGIVRIDGEQKSVWPKLVLSFEPRSINGVPVRVDVKGRGFTAALAEGETYDLFVENLPQDAYVKSIRIANFDALVGGISANRTGASTPIEIALGTPGASVSGRAFTKVGGMASGVNVSIVPVEQTGHLQDYRVAMADEYGSFEIPGVAPGKYLLFPWFDEPPCDVFDPEDRGACSAKAIEIELKDGSRLTEAVQMK